MDPASAQGAGRRRSTCPMFTAPDAAVAVRGPIEPATTTSSQVSTPTRVLELPADRMASPRSNIDAGGVIELGAAVAKNPTSTESPEAAVNDGAVMDVEDALLCPSEGPTADTPR